jgi:hypothetical protein
MDGLPPKALWDKNNAAQVNVTHQSKCKVSLQNHYVIQRYDCDAIRPSIASSVSLVLLHTDTIIW